MADFSEFMKYI